MLYLLGGSMQEEGKGTVVAEVEKVELKNGKNKYFKGLLVRIILCCTIFLLLYIMDIGKVEIMEYDTQKIVSMVEDNSFVQSIEEFISNLFSK